jgi:hypothetical protein
MISSSNRHTANTLAHTSTTGINVNTSTSDSSSTHASFSASSSSGSSPTRPGAYLTKTTVSNSESCTTTTTYNVTIPANVRPGDIFSFQVPYRQRSQRVQCPRHTRPGEVLQVTLPFEPVTTTHTVRLPSMAALTAVMASEENAVSRGGGGAVAMTPEIQRVNQLVTAARDKGAVCAFHPTFPLACGLPLQTRVRINSFR